MAPQSALAFLVRAELLVRKQCPEYSLLMTFAPQYSGKDRQVL